MLLLIFEKGHGQKNCVRCFKIRKYAFFNIWKNDEEKSGASLLRLVSILFLIVEKAMSKRTVPGILRLVSMPFNVIINVITF